MRRQQHVACRPPGGQRRRGRARSSGRRPRVGRRPRERRRRRRARRRASGSCPSAARASRGAARAGRGRAPAKRRRIAALARDRQRSASGCTRQPRLPVVKPAPAGLDGGFHGHRHALGVAPVDVDDPVGGHRPVGQPELLALEEERRAAQRQQHAPRRRGPRPVAIARGDPRVVVVVQAPRRPAAARASGARTRRRPRGSAAAATAGGGTRSCAPGGARRRRRGSAASARLVEHVDLPDGHAVAVELLEHAADRARSADARTASPRRGGGRARCRRASGSLPILCTTSMRKPSTPRRSQKRSTSCIAASTSGSSQLRSGCSARNECRYHSPVCAVAASRPGRCRRTTTSSCSAASSPVAPDVPVAPRRSRPTRDSGEPRVPVGRVVRDEVEEHAQPELVGAGDQRVGVGERAEERVDVGVVGDVVAEVGHRRAVDRRQPDRVGAEVADVLEPIGDPAQVAEAVAVTRRRRIAGRSGRRRRSATRAWSRSPVGPWRRGPADGSRRVLAACRSVPLLRHSPSAAVGGRTAAGVTSATTARGGTPNPAAGGSRG